MKIGVLTFLRVGNFGANLQALSTYNYLKRQGHEVVFLEYVSRNTLFYKKVSEIRGKFKAKTRDIQETEHMRFLDEQIPNQIRNLHSLSEVYRTIKDNHIDGIVIGSDAVAQHWPIGSTLKMGKRRPFWFEPLQQERRFPNPFWGCGFADKVPTAMMSVSSQNSKYKLFSNFTRKRIAKQLSCMKFISVRDAWTRDLMHSCDSSLNIDITPDPVFALNSNMGERIPSEKYVRNKFNLPAKYVLIGLRSQVLSLEQLSELDKEMKKEGKECVAFSIDGTYPYVHPFSYQIPLPLSPLEWFALIKYSSGYIGSNMHPIVSSLTNAVPCFSLDNWGATDFGGHKKDIGSSKVYDVLSQYGLTDYWCQINHDKCNIDVETIIEKLRVFPIEKTREISRKRLDHYNHMMQRILNVLEKTRR